jgi:hypothetical protein
MATSPQPRYLGEIDETFDFGEGGAPLPGHTIDAFLVQGKVEEARVELERLALEGLDSGKPRLMTEELLQEIAAKARVGAERRSR